jgi:Hemerythrin HHE cation binding domain
MLEIPFERTMSPSSELPDLFGRATLILGGHEGLHGTLQGLRGACVAARRGDGAGGLRQRADTFCERVLVHFAAEEGADYFGTLSGESDALAEGIARLREEHGELTRVIARLRAFRDEESALTAFAEELEGFLDRLAAHEKQETALLYGFFNPERGAKV